MHELAIVDAIIQQVTAEVQASGHAGRVKRIDLSIGRLSGVHPDSVRFGFEALSPGTTLEGAELAIEEPPALCTCSACGRETELVDMLELVAACPQCGSGRIVVHGGRELLLMSVELEETPGASS